MNLALGGLPAQKATVSEGHHLREPPSQRATVSEATVSGRPPRELGDGVPRYSRCESGFKIKVVKRPPKPNGPTATGLFIKSGCIYTLILLPLSRAAMCSAMWAWAFLSQRVSFRPYALDPHVVHGILCFLFPQNGLISKPEKGFSFGGREAVAKCCSWRDFS